MNTVGPYKTELTPHGHAGPSLEELVLRIQEDDAPRWMVAKDGLDHGPFSGREVVTMIVKGEALGEHNLTNIDTGEQSRISQYPLFSDFVGHYRERKEEETHKAALARAVKVEKLSNAAKVFVAVGIVLVALVAVTIFVRTRQHKSDDARSAEELAALYDRGEIQLEGTANVLRSGKGARGRMRRGAGSSAGASGSYEEAMNQAVDLGDISEEGEGMVTLTNEQVASSINRRMSSFSHCVSAELRSGNRLGNVGLDLVIAGNGSVLGVSVRAGSSEFRKCIAAETRQIRFPTFSAPRTSASFSFSVN